MPIIKHCGQNYSGGGTNVVANPTGSATDDLETIQIDSTIYNIPGSGGGTVGSGVYSEHVLWSGFSSTSAWTSPVTLTLNDSVWNYDMLLVKFNYTSSADSNFTIVITKGQIPTDYSSRTFSAAGYNIVASQKNFTAYVEVSSATSITGYTSTGTAMCYTEVIGLKFGTQAPVIYSTDEREIGVWTDNKPLYEKTIFLTFSQNTGSGSKAYPHNIADIDYVWVYGVTSNIQVPRISPNNSVGIQVNSTNIYCETGIDRSSVSSYITLRYTKTTDTPGSGSYTSSGSTAIHYSTNEQIIGTWIDGSTLYQKTVNCGLLPNDTTWHYTAHGISNIDKIVDVRGIAIDSNSYESIPIPNYRPSAKTGTCLVTNSDGYITYMNDWLEANEFTLYVTLQYTKSTS